MGESTTMGDGILWLMAVLRLVLLSSGYAVGLLIFSGGFLLSRQTVPNRTALTESISTSRMTGHMRVVMLVVDALRYDFVKWEDTPPQHPPPYMNKLQTVKRLLQNDPSHSLLLKFVADPPTTTLQRLKGMTTGSLPTFIDIGTNFAGGYIDEDNLIDQLVSHNRSVTFMGDDTWTALFPTQFTKSYPFPSFDVNDLDTVDNAILQHLLPTLTSDDESKWDMLIAHFLGVDHCGHRYGPYHPEMARKLSQIDDVINNVTAVLPEEAILLVLGDHGMTSRGDHGGDTLDELNAALFVYGKSLSQRPLSAHAVAQTDLVPTLALLIGVGIPFGNIGQIITELFANTEDAFLALEANAEQVLSYLKLYANVTSDPLLEDGLSQLVTEFPVHSHQYDTADAASLADRSHRLKSWLTKVRKILEKYWSKFDLIKMTLGIFCFVDNILWCAGCLIGPTENWSVVNRKLVLRAVVIAVEIGYYLLSFACGWLLPLTAVILVVSLMSHLQHIVRSIGCSRASSDHNIFYAAKTCAIHGSAILVLTLFFFSSFSNSYVIKEHNVLLLLSNTILCLLGAKSIVAVIESSRRRRKFAKQKVGGDFAWRIVKQIWLWGLCSLLQRFCVALMRCRDEDMPCLLEQKLFTKPFSALVSEPDRICHFIVVCLCLVLLNFSLRKYLTNNDNLYSLNCYQLCLKYGVGFSSFAIILYWLYEWCAPTLKERHLILQFGCPLLVYGTYMLTVIGYLIEPTCLTAILYPDKNGVIKDLLHQRAAASHDKSVASLFRVLKAAYSPNSFPQPEQLQLYVYGLSTAYSMPLFGLICSTTTVLLLLLGDTQAVGVAVFIASLLILLELLNTVVFDAFEFCLACALLTQYYFYTFGHQPEFTAIQWKAAFVGVPGNFSFQWVQAALVLANTFASQILFSLCVPMLFFWRACPLKKGIFGKRCQNKFDCLGVELDDLQNRLSLNIKGSMHTLNAKLPTDGSISEAKLISDQFLIANTISRLYFMFLNILGIKVLATMLTAALLRRHLMVWKIFAPKFVFDALGFLTCLLVSIVTLCLCCHLHSALRRTFGRLEIVQGNEISYRIMSLLMRKNYRRPHSLVTRRPGYLSTDLKAVMVGGVMNAEGKYREGLTFWDPEKNADQFIELPEPYYSATNTGSCYMKYCCSFNHDRQCVVVLSVSTEEEPNYTLAVLVVDIMSKRWFHILDENLPISDTYMIQLFDEQLFIADAPEGKIYEIDVINRKPPRVLTITEKYDERSGFIVTSQHLLIFPCEVTAESGNVRFDRFFQIDRITSECKAVTLNLLSFSTDNLPRVCEVFEFAMCSGIDDHIFLVRPASEVFAWELFKLDTKSLTWKRIANVRQLGRHDSHIMQFGVTSQGLTWMFTHHNLMTFWIQPPSLQTICRELQNKPLFRRTLI